MKEKKIYDENKTQWYQHFKRYVDRPIIHLYGPYYIHECFEIFMLIVDSRFCCCCCCTAVNQKLVPRLYGSLYLFHVITYMSHSIGFSATVASFNRFHFISFSIEFVNFSISLSHPFFPSSALSMFKQQFLSIFFLVLWCFSLSRNSTYFKIHNENSWMKNLIQLQGCWLSFRVLFLKVYFRCHIKMDIIRNFFCVPKISG